MQQRITMLTLGVADLAASAEFYEHIFGWHRTETSNENIVFFQMNGFKLALYPKEALAQDATVSSEGSGFKCFSIAYNLRSEEEVNTLFEQLETKGAQIHKKPQRVFWGGYSGYLSDPDGNLWEIAYNPFLPLDENNNVIEE